MTNIWPAIHHEEHVGSLRSPQASSWRPSAPLSMPNSQSTRRDTECDHLPVSLVAVSRCRVRSPFAQPTTCRAADSKRRTPAPSISTPRLGSQQALEQAVLLEKRQRFFLTAIVALNSAVRWRNDWKERKWELAKIGEAFVSTPSEEEVWPKAE